MSDKKAISCGSLIEIDSEQTVDSLSGLVDCFWGYSLLSAFLKKIVRIYCIWSITCNIWKEPCYVWDIESNRIKIIENSWESQHIKENSYKLQEFIENNCAEKGTDYM